MSARSELEQLRAWEKDESLDPRSLMLLCKDGFQRCWAGVQTEKINPRIEDGVSEITETHPAIALSFLGMIHKISEDEKKRLEKTPEDKTIIFNTTRKRLEDTL